jgi:alcohol dehydrogenase class IV
MRIVDRSVYVGPSLYARFPVIRLELDLGALEACARPITSSVGEAAALAILLPEVVRWNMRVVADRYAELAAVRGEARRPETLVARLEDFVLASGFPGRLGAAGIVAWQLNRVTNAKPRDLPVKRSCMIMASETVPA